VEHRARFEDPEIDVNILVRFDGNDEEKLNIVQVDNSPLGWRASP
jgi:hypothetical protein